MENFLNSLPKSLLAVLVITLFIVVLLISSPPHSVCDTQEAALRESQVGNIFPTMVKKNKIPAAIVRMKEACQLGNSPGSCYEYFVALKKVADDINKSSSECAARLYGIEEVKTNLNDGVELMVRLAWGTKPPEPGVDRFGWMQEAEIAIFCRLKNMYLRAQGEEAWVELRKRVVEKLPGEELVSSTDPSLAVNLEPRKATTLLSEQDIWNRSLFSVRCEAY